MPDITHLTLDVPGATPGEIRCGLEAAQRVLAAAGFDAYYAATHHWLYGVYRDLYITVPHQPDFNAYIAWENAAGAAIEACCAGWDWQLQPFPLGALNLSDAYMAEMRQAHAELAATYAAVLREMFPPERAA